MQGIVLLHPPVRVSPARRWRLTAKAVKSLKRLLSCSHLFPTLFFVPHDRRARRYTPLHSTPHAAKTVGQTDRKKKTEKEGKGRLRWRRSRGGREGGLEGGTPPSSKPLHRQGEKTLSLFYTGMRFSSRRELRERVFLIVTSAYFAFK